LNPAAASNNPSPASAAAAAAADAPGTYRIGTLTYTRFGLLSVFFWMLWGDLCVNIMETIIPRIVPLQLARAGALATTIGLVTASVPAGVELIVNPFVSTYSDRYRSRFGRRRPFILFCTPILALFLLAIGFTDIVAPRIHAALGGLGMTPQTMTIVMLGVLLAIFQFFNVVVLATYYYLIADVVPQQVIGKFTSLYKVVGALGGVIFNKFIFRYADQYQWQIYFGCAAVYVFAFMLMGWRVKEGEYPPPERLSADGGGALSAAGQWLRESFAIRFYQKLYLIGLFYWAAFGAFIFQQMYALNDLGISKAAAGDSFAWAGLLTLPLFFVLGPLSDRFHPVRMVTLGMFLMGCCSLACFFFIDSAAMRPMWSAAWGGVRGQPWLAWMWTKVLGAAPSGAGPDTQTLRAWQFTLWTTIWTVGQTLYYGAQISLLPRVLPREQYGQYCAANNTLCAVAKFGAPVLCGWLIVKLGHGYRINYLWSAGCCFAGVIACLAVWSHWKRLGGDAGYVPPRLARTGGGANVEVAPVADPADMAVPGATAVEAGRPEALAPATTSQRLD